MACEAWSGDIMAMQFDNPDIKFVVPEEGLSLWSDNMMVPNKADAPGQRREADELLLRARGRRHARRLGLTTSARSQGAEEAMEKIDPEPGRQPADLPDRRGPRQDLRLHAGPRRDPAGLRQAVQPSDRSLIPMSADEMADAGRRGREGRISADGSDLVLSGVTKQLRDVHRRRRPRPDRPPGRRSSRCSARPAAARPPPCGWSPGSRTPTAGTIRLGDQDITHLKPYKRPVNTVFQSYALFPHLTIFENVAFGLRRQGKSGRQAAGRRDARAGRARQYAGRKPDPALRRPAAARRAGPGADQPARRCCCSTSRSARSTSSCAGRCRSSSSGSRPRSGSPSSTSPTTRRRP